MNNYQSASKEFCKSLRSYDSSGYVTIRTCAFGSHIPYNPVPKACKSYELPFVREKLPDKKKKSYVPKRPLQWSEITAPCKK